MVKDILASHEERMKKSIEALKHEFASLRAGRATPSLLDKVMVNYYGAPTPVNQIAKVTVPEPRMIMIQPWEKSILHDIEVAIMKSDLGLNPNSDGTAIRLTIPQLTQERRQELVKAVNKKAEEAKVALRNIRRDGNDEMKKLEKGKEITEDESKRGQESMQKLVDKYIKQVDTAREAKEKAKEAVANSSSQGITRSKAACPVWIRIHDPSTPPAAARQRRTPRCFLTFLSSWR